MMAARRPSDVEFSRQAISYVDERTGVLRRLGERDLAQEPLHLCETVPAGCEPVFGVGLTFAAARIRAARRGLVCHAVATANRSVPAWGYRLADGKPLPLNPRIAYPRDAHPPGISDGVDYSDALARTLAEHATLLTVTEAVHPLIDHGVLELAAAHLDDEGAQYRRMIDILRIDLAIHDITSQLGVPTLAFSIGDKVVCCAGAPRMHDVLRRGLRRVLLAHQARVHRQPEYAPPLVTALTGRSWSAATAPAPPDLVGAPDAQVSALIGAGYQPVVVPLDHDPKLRRLVPCLLRTVLLR
jgi:hypothetical protein